MLNVKQAWKNWQLLTEKGRHIWAFKSASSDINEHLQQADNISEQEINQAIADFEFDKSINPNSGDKVFRSSAISSKYQAFNGQIPQVADPKKQSYPNSTVSV